MSVEVIVLLLLRILLYSNYSNYCTDTSTPWTVTMERSKRYGSERSNPQNEKDPLRTMSTVFLEESRQQQRTNKQTSRIMVLLLCLLLLFILLTSFVGVALTSSNISSAPPSSSSSTMVSPPADATLPRWDLNLRFGFASPLDPAIDRT